MLLGIKANFMANLADKYRLLFWVIVPLLFFMFSIAVIGFYALQTQRSQAINEINSARRFIDTVLGDANLTAGEAMGLLGRPCESIVDQLRILGLKNSLVRTVTLSRNGSIYCAPVPLPANLKPRPYVTVGDGDAPEIELKNGTLLFPGIPVIVLRRHRIAEGVSVVIDTQYLSYMMGTVGTNNPIYLNINDQMLTMSGVLITSRELRDGFISISRTSQQFPYSLKINISHSQFLRYLLNTYAMVILLSVVVCLVMSVFIRNWLTATSSIRANMAQALKRNEFQPYFQPVVDAAHNYCTGIEILMRWRHPTDGLVPPDVFVPLAEESGLIIPLTQQLMQRVARVIAASQVQWREPLHIAFNISAVHLSNRQIVDDCALFLQTVKGKKISLVLELTERQFVDITPTTLKVLNALKQSGVFLAIDDFGTGYSGLSYLSKMDIDFLKIDQSFVAMIEEEAASRIIVNAVIDLARRLNMSLIAEGVENVGQKAYLLDKHVFYQQGYLFGKPMPMTQFPLYMAEEQARYAIVPIAL